MATRFIVFPHQLFRVLLIKPKDTIFVMVEDESIFRQDPPNLHQIFLERAAMQAFRERLLVKGYKVEYFDTVHYQRLEQVFTALAAKKVPALQLFELDNPELEARLIQQANRQKIKLSFDSTPAFLTTPAWLTKNFSRKSLTPERLFQGLQERFGTEIKNGKRRTTTDANPPTLELELPPANRYEEEALQYLQKQYQVGQELDGFAYPVTHADAEDWLLDFLEKGYGVEQQQVLVPALAIGLLTPEQIITRALRLHKKEQLPQNRLEPLLFWLLGEREFVRALTYLT